MNHRNLFVVACSVMFLAVAVIASCGGDGATSQNPEYSVIYNGNGNTGGSAPTDATSYGQGQRVTVLGNTGKLVKTNFHFAGWNTQANGSGTTYAQAQTFSIGMSNVTLYAIWVSNSAITLRNDGFTGVEAVGFFNSFIAGDAAAVILGPVSEAATIDGIEFLFGGGGSSQNITLSIYDDSDLGLVFHSANYAVTPSNTTMQVIYLSNNNINILPGTRLRVAIYNNHSGFPSVARDTDGIANNKNWLYSSSSATWQKSESLGIAGDWIIRANLR